MIKFSEPTHDVNHVSATLGYPRVAFARMRCCSLSATSDAVAAVIFDFDNENSQQLQNSLVLIIHMENNVASQLASFTT